MEGKSNGRSPSAVRYVANGHANGVANHRTDRNLILQAENNGVYRRVAGIVVSCVVVRCTDHFWPKAHGRSTR